ncbi:DUF1641 domain-containing protein [Bacillus smithii]|uniref:DUF1641 domain-containing protein n=1 Tax=Bacillus smithii TaxID=1479 RepID=UPI003D1FFFBD
MAKPISAIEKQHPDPHEETSEALAEMGEKLANSREAVLKTLDILQEMQKSGILDILYGLLKSREKVGAVMIEQINHPKYHHVIKNGFQLLATLESEQLESIFNAMKKGIEQLDQPTKKQQSLSLWGMMKAVRDPYINSALSMMLHFLHGVGKGLESQKQLKES